MPPNEQPLSRDARAKPKHKCRSLEPTSWIRRTSEFNTDGYDVSKHETRLHLKAFSSLGIYLSLLLVLCFFLYLCNQKSAKYALQAENWLSFQLVFKQHGFFFRLQYVFSQVHQVESTRGSIRFDSLQQKFHKYRLIYVRAISYWWLRPREYKKDQYREATV